MRTRPDIAFVVNRLQRRTANPRKQDLEALSQMLRYLKGAPDYGIQLTKDPNHDLIGYVDASYNDCEDGKSTEAYVFYYAGAPISWSSRKQDIVATWSTVAEYIALDGAVRDASYLVKVLRQLDLFEDPNFQIPICTDSDTAVAILRNDAYKKEYEVAWHQVSLREARLEGEMGWYSDHWFEERSSRCLNEGFAKGWVRKIEGVFRC